MLLIWTNLDTVLDAICPEQVHAESFEEPDYEMLNQHMIHNKTIQLNVIKKRRKKRRGAKRKSQTSRNLNLITSGNTAPLQLPNELSLNSA